jgi:hypothetical protein
MDFLSDPSVFASLRFKFEQPGFLSVFIRVPPWLKDRIGVGSLPAKWRSLTDGAERCGMFMRGH